MGEQEGGMPWETAAQIVGILVGAVTLYRLCVSPVVKDRADAWERIRELKAQVKELESEVRTLRGKDAE